MPGLTVRAVERWGEATLGIVASAALFAMMVLTFVDVVGRYFFSAPVMGAMEIIEVLLVLTVFAGLPLAAIKQSHIEIDVLANCFPAWAWAWLLKAGHGMFAVALAFVAWRLVLRAHQLVLDGEVTAILNIPVLLVAWSMVVLTAAAALLHLLKAITCPVNAHD